MSKPKSCPPHNPDCPGIKKCPYFLTVLGKCFDRCGYPNSEVTCGQCAHWYGAYTLPDRPRSKGCGFCIYMIGNVSSTYQTNCKHFHPKDPDELSYPDWIEKRVVELGGSHDSEPFSRQCRKQAIKEWKEKHN